MTRPAYRRRTRRLRKKLHVGEFRELGFAVSLRLSRTLSDRDFDDFWTRFIVHAIEARHLAFGGGQDGFVTRAGRGSADEADREAVRAWLEAQPGVEAVTVGPLEDAWYGPSGSGEPA